MSERPMTAPPRALAVREGTPVGSAPALTGSTIRIVLPNRRR
jgi:hypothetical protein